MKVIFMGTPNIGTSVLKALIDLNLEIVGVVCQPDREMDRKKNYIFSPVKKMALENNIPIFQPEKIKEITNEIKNINPDIIITCAYGQFINSEILAIPKFGCINVHASLLPKLRGGAPIHWAIINQEKTTGISLMDMVSKMDAGDVYLQYECLIDEFETYDSLYSKLSNLAYKIVFENFFNLIDKKLSKKVQDESLVTFGYNIKKEESIINFDDLASNVDSWIRGLTSKPGAVWNYQNQNIKILKAKITNKQSTLPPGTIVAIDKNGIQIATKDFNILLEEIQLPNKKPTLISQIINGNHIFQVGSK